LLEPAAGLKLSTLELEAEFSTTLLPPQLGKLKMEVTFVEIYGVFNFQLDWQNVERRLISELVKMFPPHKFESHIGLNFSVRVGSVLYLAAYAELVLPDWSFPANLAWPLATLYRRHHCGLKLVKSSSDFFSALPFGHLSTSPLKS
jgi:hypothetical protein